MDWKEFFEKKQIEYKKPPTYNIYIAPEHTSATQELKNQKVEELRGDYLVTKSTVTKGLSSYQAEHIIRYEDIYYVYLVKECLIVTAALGTATAREVVWLKDIRDDYISKSYQYFKVFGIFETLYYLFSPQVSRAMLRNSRLKNFIRILLVSPFLKVLRVLQTRMVPRIFQRDGDGK